MKIWHTSLRFYRMILEGIFFWLNISGVSAGGSSIQHPKDYMQKMGVRELNGGWGWAVHFTKVACLYGKQKPYLALTTFFFESDDVSSDFLVFFLFHLFD